MKTSPMSVQLVDSHAVCKGCMRELPLSEFPTRKDRSGRKRPYCAACTRDSQRARYAAHKRNSPFKLKASRARSRSQYLKVPFDLDAAYLESIWNPVCPVFGIPISIVEKDRSDEFAAELDRFIPSRGYVKGNVTFISRRANRLKNSVTTEELSKLIEWMEKYENKSDVSKTD